MKRSAIKNLALLGYLAFFLNLGPALHRAPIFGLHDHGQHADLNEHCLCSCGHDHGASQQKDDSESPDQSVKNQLCDCSLCQFFKQYNVSFQFDEVTFHQQRIPFKSGLVQSPAERVAIRKSARGPPTT